MKYVSYLCGALLALMLATIIGQIVIRVCGFGVSWTEELARYAMIYMVFFGSVASLGCGTHIAVTLLVDMLPTPAKVWSFLIRDLLNLSVLAVLTPAALDLISRPVIINQLTPALQFPTAALYAALAISSVGMTVICLGHVVRDVRGIRASIREGRAS